MREEKEERYYSSVIEDLQKKISELETITQFYRARIKSISRQLQKLKSLADQGSIVTPDTLLPKKLREQLREWQQQDNKKNIQQVLDRFPTLEPLRDLLQEMKESYKQTKALLKFGTSKKMS